MENKIFYLPNEFVSTARTARRHHHFFFVSRVRRTFPRGAATITEETVRPADAGGSLDSCACFSFYFLSRFLVFKEGFVFGDTMTDATDARFFSAAMARYLCSTDIKTQPNLPKPG